MKPFEEESMMKALLGFFVALAITTGAAAQAQLVTEEMMVKSPDTGFEIYVRNKRPAAMTSFRPERTVLFVHGATYPAHAAFDLKLGGQSWMEHIASRGYDVYLLDLPGYGKSTRPKEMAEPAQNNPPFMRGESAVKNIGAVVDHILARRNIPRVNLLGWSWGTTLMATYTTQNPGKVERLALYAPPWIRQTAHSCRPARARSGPIARCGAIRLWGAG
jgi:pimeloyl-ACP methyl ester carboxylesterase